MLDSIFRMLLCSTVNANHVGSKIRIVVSTQPSCALPVSVCMICHRLIRSVQMSPDIAAFLNLVNLLLSSAAAPTESV